MIDSFSRQGVVDELRPRLWSYVSGSGVNELASTHQDLNVMRRDAMRELLAAHIVLAPGIQEMLNEADAALRLLQGRSSRLEVELLGETAGEVRWARTFVRRLEEGDDTIFVSAPAERLYNTRQGRVIRTALEMAVQLSRIAEPMCGRRQPEVEGIANQARDLLSRVKLARVRPLHSVSDEALDGLATRPHMALICTFVRWMLFGIGELRPDVIREILDDTLLAPESDATLFELMVGFRLIDAFRPFGFTLDHINAVVGSGQPFAVLTGRGDTKLRILRQTSLGRAGAPGTSLYSEVRRDAGLSDSALIPDFILEFHPGGGIVVVEVKLSEEGGARPIRSGTIEAFAYLLDRPGAFSGSPHPHAIVVAWGAPARPSATSRVMLTSQAGIADAVELIVAARATGATTTGLAS